MQHETSELKFCVAQKKTFFCIVKLDSTLNFVLFCKAHRKRAISKWNQSWTIFIWLLSSQKFFVMKIICNLSFKNNNVLILRKSLIRKYEIHKIQIFSLHQFLKFKNYNKIKISYILFLFLFREIMFLKPIFYFIIFLFRYRLTICFTKCFFQVCLFFSCYFLALRFN